MYSALIKFADGCERRYHQIWRICSRKWALRINTVRDKIDSVVKATAEDWDRTFAVNAKGTFFCYKHAGLQMVTQGRGGRIIGASSVAGKKGITAVTFD